MKFIIAKPYRYILLSVALVYLAVVVWITDFYTVFSIALQYAETVSWLKLGASMGFSLILAMLVGMNACYIYRFYKIRRNCKKGSALTGIGAVGGLAVGVCPVCVGGLMQLLFVAFGISFTFAMLPFDGLEVQAGLILLLSFNIWLMEKKYKKEGIK